MNSISHLKDKIPLQNKNVYIHTSLPSFLVNTLKNSHTEVMLRPII